MSDTLWDEVLARVEGKVNRHSFATWFRPTTFLSLEGSTLRIGVPNAQFREWLSKNYLGVLQEALAELGPARRSGSPSRRSPRRRAAAAAARCRPPSATPRPSTRSTRSRASWSAPPTSSPTPPPGRSPRSPRSPTTRSSSTAASASARRTSCTRSATTSWRARSGSNVLYISTDRFINEMINAIRFDRLPSFRQKYRAIDVLLVDDIQFIAGKDRTQEEFFHIFNALHDAQKQIVIELDCPPRQIPTIEERLHSRFEWGLIADIQPPDIETKVAILRKKAEAERVELPENVALFIASKVKTNIRELEGSLIRLIAYASLTGRDIDLPLAQETLRDLLHTEDKPITIEMIQKFVADHYSLKLSELKAKNNSKSIAVPRQIAMYLTKSLTGASLPEIGKEFGGKHHSTVIHSIRKIDDLRKQDPEFDRLINSFVQAFR